MKKLHTADNLVSIMHLKNVLEMQGIECEVRNQFLSGALGDVPAFECWPQLWVRHPADWSRAQDILKTHQAPAEPSGEPWTCGDCGERLEAQFSECWQCGGEPA